MRILITGAAGQLGRRLATIGDHEVALACRAGGSTLPGARTFRLEDQVSCERLVAHERPEWIVHAAALTDVDACERDPQRAHVLNASGTQHLAQAAAAHGARMLYVSTDYVFDGAHAPFSESDPPSPRSAYARSKLEGELLGRDALGDIVVARTSGLFGPHGRNFVRWVRDTLASGGSVRVARDQWLNPTSTADLARQLVALIEADAEGVFHTAGATGLARHDAALEIARAFSLPAEGIIPVDAASLGWQAPRPRDSRLDLRKIGRYAAPMPFSDALVALRAELEASAPGSVAA